MKDNIEKWRHFNKSGSSLSFCFLSTITAVIQVIFIQYLWFKIPLQSKLQFVIVDFFVHIFYCYNEILEVLLSCRLIQTLMAFGVMYKFAFKVVFNKVLVDVILAFSGEGFLEGLKEYSVELLNVLLHLSFFIFPLETFDELVGSELFRETCL